MKPCPRCGTNNPNGVIVCGSCGASLAGVPVVATGPAPDGGAHIRVTPVLIGLVAVVLLFGLCMLLDIGVSFLEDLPDPDEPLGFLLNALLGLSDLLGVLLSLAGGLLLVTRLDLSRWFTPADALVQIILVLIFAGLLYAPLSFVFTRLLAFSYGTPAGYSLVPLCEGFILLLALIGLFFLLRRQQSTTL